MCVYMYVYTHIYYIYLLISLFFLLHTSTKNWNQVEYGDSQYLVVSLAALCEIVFILYMQGRFFCASF